MNGRETLEAALVASGISARRFASLLARDEKTFRSWRNGVGEQSEPPAVAVKWCARFLAMPARLRKQVVQALVAPEKERQAPQKAETPRELVKVPAAKWTPPPKAEWVKPGDWCVSIHGMVGHVERIAPSSSEPWAVVLWKTGYRGRLTITQVRKITKELADTVKQMEPKIAVVKNPLSRSAT